MITLPIHNSSEVYTVQPTKIICLGLNYRDHIGESISVKIAGADTSDPPEPVLFPKTPNVLVGPGEAIVLPAIADGYAFDEPRTDYEAELAVIIGRDCKNVAEADAMDVVFGFTCMNDVSQRNIQNGDRAGWFRGKSFDTFGPIGPVVVRAADIGDAQNLSIRCRLNGKVVQDSNTRNMIFGINQMVSFISANFTLRAGDIIMTGTPSGVGPIEDGDTVEVEIEKIGVLTNPVRNER